MNKQSEKPTRASFPMNAAPVEGVGGIVEEHATYIATGSGPELVITPEDAPVVRMPTAEVLCNCGQVLVHIQPLDGAAILHTYERNIMRPHTLTDTDLPLVWRCPACGQQTRIG